MNITHFLLGEMKIIIILFGGLLIIIEEIMQSLLIQHTTLNWFYLHIELDLRRTDRAAAKEPHNYPIIRCTLKKHYKIKIIWTVTSYYYISCQKVFKLFVGTSQIEKLNTKKYFTEYTFKKH